MRAINLTAQAWLVVLVALLPAPASHSISQDTKDDKAVVFPVDEKTAVRFFFQPDDGNYFHFPLVFRSVSQGDPRLNTAPMADEGRTVYISDSEMRQLLRGLAHSELSWTESASVQMLGPARKLEKSQDMIITYVSANASATASVRKNKICATLKGLDPAIKTPRALWEFQRFELDYNCKVLGFVYDAYPDHY
jgi:hypothetical protein